jgi:DNA-binding NarL/FixJ family response regulator
MESEQSTGRSSSRPTTVFVVDDHEVVRLGLRNLLNAADDIEVVGDAGDVDGAVAGIAETQPDVAVVDVQLGSGSGIEVCRDARHRSPRTLSVFLTSFEDDETLFQAIDAGAAAYVLKQVRGTDLVDTVRRVAAGESALDPAVTTAVLQRLRADARQQGALESLTTQERRMLELVAQGRTNREIASMAGLAEKTVKNYVSSMLNKLGVQNRTQAALLVNAVARPRR